MKLSHTFRYVVTVLVAAAMCLQTAVAALAAPYPDGNSPGGTPVAQDVALAAGGVLRGTVLDEGGAPVAGADVVLYFAGRRVAATRTDEAGRFTIADLRGGTHLIDVAGNQQTVRLWADKTAPPAAVAGVLVVTRDGLTRGQLGGGMTAGGVVAIAAILGVAYAVYEILDVNPSKS